MTSSTSRCSRTTSIPTRCRSRSCPTSSRSPTRASSSPPTIGCATTRRNAPASTRPPIASRPKGSPRRRRSLISVSEPDPETNAEPVPTTVTGRVIAGETVRIPIPLGGVDPDGDSVQLLGQYSNPARGAVIETGPDWFDYEAGEYSEGADQFQYSVVDAMGARANGTVRLGIAQRTTEPQKPIAVEDEITVRPGRTISVRVLANDSDPAGGRAHAHRCPAGHRRSVGTGRGGLDRGEGPRRRGRVRLHLRDPERAAQHGEQLPQDRGAKRRAARASRSRRHRARTQRHPRHRTHRRAGAAQRLPRRRRCRRTSRGARRRVRARRGRESRRHDPGRRRGPAAHHPVHGQPPRGSDHHRACLHLGSRPRRRASAVAQGRRPVSRCAAARRSSSNSPTT